MAKPIARIVSMLKPVGAVEFGGSIDFAQET
jgi:hypothetical protein